MIIERLFPLLISGDRAGARTLVEQVLDDGATAEDFVQDVCWPVLEQVNALHRSDTLTNLAHHYATRLLRSLVDQLQASYEQAQRRGRTVLMFCGPGEADDLAGQIVADLAEADGYEVFFGGGGIANDEILREVGERTPDVLLVFSAAPSDAPNIRQLIDYVRGIDACPGMQIAVGGGVFNRADGLAEEIGADLWASDPSEMLERLEAWKDRRATPEQRTVGQTRGTKAA